MTSTAILLAATLAMPVPAETAESPRAEDPGAITARYDRGLEVETASGSI